MHYTYNKDEKLKDLPVEDVWGVGKQLTKFYTKNIIEHAADILDI